MRVVDPALVLRARQRFSDLDRIPIGLAVLDADLSILYWNDTMENWTGFSKDQAVGAPMSTLNPIWSRPHYASRLSHLFQGGPPVVFSPLLHPQVVPLNHGGDQSFQVKATTIPDGEGSWWALLSVEDVTVLSRRVEELRTLRGQQDRLMREIHHRVKNSLNMISGLITLQKAQPGEGGTGALDDLQSRIVAISEIHDILYHSSSLSAGSTAEYLEALAQLLDKNLSLSEDHRLVLDLDRTIVLKTDTMMILGLIQAELMTNALKYGLGKQDGEELCIRLSRVGPKLCEFELSHTGDRLPDDFDPATSPGLGMVLLTAYATQLGTKLQWTKGNPTKFWLRFAE